MSNTNANTKILPAGIILLFVVFVLGIMMDEFPKHNLVYAMLGSAGLLAIRSVLRYMRYICRSEQFSRMQSYKKYSHSYI
jgi:hypothetical protein